MANFGLLAAEIGSEFGAPPPAYCNGFHVLAALRHGTLVRTSAKLCGVEQRAPPIFGRAAKRPSCWALTHILVKVWTVLSLELMKLDT